MSDTIVPRERANHPGIDGTWHRYGRLYWWDPIPGDQSWCYHYEHPECPVEETATDGTSCRLICGRITGDEGRGAFYCPLHGVFRVFGWRREDRETSQTGLGAFQEGSA